MKSMNVKKILLILIFASALGFTACGGDSGSDDGWVAEYAIGDTGPAGGTIFYVDPAGLQ